MMFWRKVKFFLFFCIIIVSSNAEELNNIDLEALRKSGAISQEDYDILSSGSELTDGDYLYELRVNGELKSKIYEVILKNKKNYFPLKSFLKAISFTNYVINMNEEKMRFYLGDSLKEVKLEKDKLKIDGENEITLGKDSYFQDGDEVYLEEELFKSIFLKVMRIDNENFKLNLYLNFASPEDIKVRVERTKSDLEDEKDINTLFYTNKNKLFELGYLRTKFNQLFIKDKSKSDRFKRDWEADLEYQGATLYGQLTANYDVKETKFDDVTLRYNDIWENHTLELGTYSAGDYSRESGLSFKKEKGYIITSNKTYIIKENVPIGSRVELLYMGFPIDVKDAENGVVEFDNPEIKSDREYTLKIYQASGEITFVKISTASDYNQQNKGEIEYDINIREDDNSKKIKTDSNIYYGLLDNLTVGLGYEREIEEIDNKYRYLENGRLELVYSNFIYNYPYTIVGGGEKTFNKIYDKNNERNTKDRVHYDFKGQLDIDNLRFKVEHENKDSYYDEKQINNYNVQYRPFKSLRFEYEYERTDYYKEERDSDSKFKTSFSRNLKNILVTAEHEASRKDKDTYNLNFYYNGFRTFTTRWENKWEDDGKNYETALTLFNSSNRILDYTVQARYSEKNKDMLTFKFNIKLDNWLNFDMFADKKGNQEYKIGIDRITDLKNPMEKVENMDSSRVKVITFIDINDNNIWDETEPRINNVKVKIGDKEVITDKKGEGMFYGIPNHMKYNLNPSIRKPSFVLGTNKIVIKGKNTSTLEAYIPVKPMLTLTGIINIDDNLVKENSSKMALYGDILVKVKDIKGKVIDMSIPDETGIFEISGLLPKQYYIEVSYIGINYNIKKLDEIIKLAYIDNSRENNYVLNISKDSISFLKKGEEL